MGEIGEAEKNAFLGDAAALLFPIDWPEPFGLVMIEAMACGTPVVAFRCGSVPEVMRDGVSGYVVDTIDEAVAATARAVELPRARVRAYFDERFSAPRMAEDYVAIYEALIEDARRAPRARADRVRAGGDRQRRRRPGRRARGGRPGRRRSGCRDGLTDADARTTTR